ncbi:hypothetical protein [Pseudomonas sp.]|uniref:hypothetical protein n=1 Tax=Pseudomonas sp. TaxID=306 RepID=UPI00289D1E9D|nr:hypothetical protein [Pseudomonas sp.]
MGKETDFQVKLPVLFATACAAKIACLITSFILGELLFSGFIVPITIMLAYVVIGGKYKTSDVSDEKFADSCYYLGFIFTIASIIVCLIDLPNIQNDMITIATRFGVAMISTIVGLTVRVILVSFRPNMEDALRNHEQSAVDASRRLTDEYARAFHALVHFRGEVIEATTESVKVVRESFDEMAKESAARMDAHAKELSEQMGTHFKELSERINYAFIENIRELKKSSMSLNLVVDKYAKETSGSLMRLDQNMGEFTKTVISRLEAVSFPDDLFSQKLNKPIDELTNSAGDVGQVMRVVTRDINGAAKAVEKSISKINEQSEAMSSSIELVRSIAEEQTRLVELIRTSHELAQKQSAHHDAGIERLSGQQQTVNERLDQQITNLNVMSKSASQMTEAVTSLVSQITQGQHVTATLLNTVEKSHVDQQALLNGLKVTLEALPMLVHDSRAQSETVGAQIREALQSNTTSTHIMKQALEHNEQSISRALEMVSSAGDHTQLLASKLDDVIQTTQALHGRLDIATSEQSRTAPSEAQGVQDAISVPATCAGMPMGVNS